MPGIFINYRSNDDDFGAALVDDRLRAVFGDEFVFRDSRSLSAGTHFPPELWRRLTSSTVLLALIGPRWLTLTTADGARRIDDPDDFVRQEIRVALNRNMVVVPVLLNGATLPGAAELPEDIRDLTLRQYVPLRQRHSTIDLDHLVDQLGRLVPAHHLPPRLPDDRPGPAVFDQGGMYFGSNATFHGDAVGRDKNVGVPPNGLGVHPDGAGLPQHGGPE